jgi:hypothetical protein
MIKKEQMSPMLSKKSINNLMMEEKNIHVRRHSVMGSRMKERG